MLSILRKLIFRFSLKTPSRLSLNTNNLFNKYHKCETKKYSFGEKNSDKIFYVIKRTPGTGFFSNVLFVINHLMVAKKNNYISIVDMENFPTIYNEKNQIFKTNNSWEYYFENLNETKLEEIYQSKNVIITSNKFEVFFEQDLISEEIKKTFRENLKIKKKFEKIISIFANKNFKDKRVLGVHFRGTSYKGSAGHPFPATKIQIFNLINKLIKNEKYEKIFLVTEEENYKNFLNEKFKDKLIFINSSFRSNENNAFKIYPRKNHRYKLGREALIEANLLSRCDGLVYVTSNISSAAIAWNLNNTQKRFKIDNGINTKNVILSRILWYVKKIVPEFIGGFKKNL